MKKFPINKKVERAVAAIWDATENRTRGDVLTHDELERWSGIGRYAQGWSTLVVKLKKKFQRERGVTLWSVVDVGYKLMDIDEQLNDAPRNRCLRAYRQLNRGVAHVEAIQEPLSGHQEHIRATRIMQHRNALKQVRIARKVTASISRPSGRG